MLAVIVTGLPGSGKTTLATALAERLELPLIRGDQIKEILYDALGDALTNPRALGPASFALMHALAAGAPRIVLESFFWPGVAEAELIALNRPLIQVHCSCPPALARARFEARSAAGERHAVHHEMDDWNRFAETGGLLTLPGTLIRVDTSASVDLEALVPQVVSAIADRVP